MSIIIRLHYTHYFCLLGVDLSGFDWCFRLYGKVECHILSIILLSLIPSFQKLTRAITIIDFNAKLTLTK